MDLILSNTDKKKIEKKLHKTDDQKKDSKQTVRSIHGLKHMETDWRHTEGRAGAGLRAGQGRARAHSIWRSADARIPSPLLASVALEGCSPSPGTQEQGSIFLVATLTRRRVLHEGCCSPFLSINCEKTNGWRTGWLGRGVQAFIQSRNRNMYQVSLTGRC